MIEIPKQLKQDLDQIMEVSKELQMKIYIVGGFPRDIVSGFGISDDTDLDLTEENGNGFDLAFFVSAKYDLMEPVIYPSTGTALLVMPSGRPVEFHNSYYNVPHIIDQLYVLGIEPTSLNKDVFSRDFTINTLLFDPETGEINDLTGMGIPDIENKILRTPVTPAKTLSLSPKNILRGIRFCIQFGLTPDPEYAKQSMTFVPYLIDFLQKNPDSKMVNKTVSKTVKMDPIRAIEEYKRFGILEYLPNSLFIDADASIKEQMFGTNISPVASKKEAQTKMIDHLLQQREKHKAYMRRKRREEKQEREKKFKILDRAETGYYINNPEPDFVNNRKIDKKKKIFDIIQGNY